MNVATLARSSAAIRDISSTAVRVCASAWDVVSAAVETSVMVSAIRPVPPVASATDRVISFVVAVCSSTAPAMVVYRSAICATIVLISSMAETAARVALDGLHPAGDVLGDLGRLLGQLLDLVGHDGEALAGFAG